MKTDPIVMQRYNYKTFKPEPIEVLSDDLVATKTYEAATAVMTYFKTEYGRDSFDNKGTPLSIVVGYSNAGGAPINNAQWNEREKSIYFGDGDGVRFTPLGTAKDIVAHEFMHGVINSEVSLAYSGESGGIHESFSDILATGLDNNYQIGEDVYTPGIKGDAIRDISKLDYTNIAELPGPDQQYFGEPHLMSEPLSHAAYLAASEIGIDKVRDIWYSAIVDYMEDNSGFLGARQATLAAVNVLYGESETNAITQAWDAVGILGAQ